MKVFRVSDDGDSASAALQHLHSNSDRVFRFPYLSSRWRGEFYFGDDWCTVKFLDRFYEALAKTLSCLNVVVIAASDPRPRLYSKIGNIVDQRGSRHVF